VLARTVSQGGWRGQLLALTTPTDFDGGSAAVVGAPVETLDAVDDDPTSFVAGTGEQLIGHRLFGDLDD